ncbi:MAG: hypothetical protein JXN65_09435 [Clostridia bacterium]|nr:hypothetical protein [Clostridia bacterium]
MNCYKCKKMIEKIHNDCINSNELQSVKNHILKCESCRAYYNVMEQMVKDLASLEQKELPVGFHNKLHFALQRESKQPSKASFKFSRGLKIAAVSAFSALLIIAAVNILPRQGVNVLPKMAMDEAMEAPAEESDTMFDVTTESQTNALEYSMAGEMEDAAPQEDVSRDSVEDNEKSANSLSAIESGDTIILMIESDDAGQTYQDISQSLPESLPPANKWMLDNLDEPSDYLEIRLLLGLNEALSLSGEISSTYADELILSETRHLEYENYAEETAGLSDIVYVLIIIEQSTQ